MKDGGEGEPPLRTPMVIMVEEEDTIMVETGSGIPCQKRESLL